MLTNQQKGGHRTPHDDRPNNSRIPNRGSDLLHSSKHTPCPACGRTKDPDCSWTPDAEKVLCHTYAKESAPNVANGYHFTGKYCDDGIHGPDTAAIYVKNLNRDDRPLRGTRKVKSRKEENRTIQLSAAHVETEVDHLTTLVLEGLETPEQALVTLAAWCKEHDHDKYAASQLLKAKLKQATGKTSQIASDEAPRILREYHLIEQHFGERLKLNDLFKQVELDGEPFKPVNPKLEMVVNHGLNLKGSREDVGDTIVMLARQNRYNPVVDYLERVHQQHGDDTSILDGLVKRHLGSDEALHHLLMIRFLVACVARAFEPGCKHDCALILQGPQGCGKSTFFRVLASDTWFDDSLGDASDRDERLKLHIAWIIEWAELETVFKRRDVSQVKAFLTTQTDRVRPPYGREIEILNRSSVIVGTTNEDDFLTDSTGNRRFWIIPMRKSLDREQLELERDQIWAAAVTLYRQGEPHNLSPGEEQAMKSEREQYEFHDTWLDKVSQYIQGREWVSTSEILTHAINLELSQHDTKHIKRVCNILKRLGWKSTNSSRLIDGIRRKGWTI